LEKCFIFQLNVDIPFIFGGTKSPTRLIEKKHFSNGRSTQRIEQGELKNIAPK